MATVAVQVHHLRARHSKARLSQDVKLERHVRNVLFLHVQRRLHLDQDIPVPLALQDIDRNENATSQEAGLVDHGRT